MADFDKPRTVSVGRVGLPFPGDGLQARNPLNSIKDTLVAVRGTFRESPLGTPYTLQTVLDGFTLPNEPIITMSAQNRIVSTQVAGGKRKGDVRELTSLGDYGISIQGLLVGESKQDMLSQLGRFKALTSKRDSLLMENELCNMLGVTRVVVTDCAYAVVQGGGHTVAYTLSLLSEEDFELELIEDSDAGIGL